jgi:hypothetical protein
MIGVRIRKNDFLLIPSYGLGTRRTVNGFHRNIGSDVSLLKLSQTVHASATSAIVLTTRKVSKLKRVKTRSVLGLLRRIHKNDVPHIQQQ